MFVFSLGNLYDEMRIFFLLSGDQFDDQRGAAACLGQALGLQRTVFKLGTAEKAGADFPTPP